MQAIDREAKLVPVEHSASAREVAIAEREQKLDDRQQALDALQQMLAEKVQSCISPSFMQAMLQAGHDHLFVGYGTIWKSFPRLR